MGPPGGMLTFLPTNTRANINDDNKDDDKEEESDSDSDSDSGPIGPPGGTLTFLPSNTNNTSSYFNDNNDNDDGKSTQQTPKHGQHYSNDEVYTVDEEQVHGHQPQMSIAKTTMPKKSNKRRKHEKHRKVRSNSLADRKRSHNAVWDLVYMTSSPLVCVAGIYYLSYYTIIYNMYNIDIL